MEFVSFVAVLLIAAVVLVLMGVKIVPQSYRWTVTRWGRYTRTLEPGLHVIVPVMEAIGAKVDMRERVLDVPAQEVITKDNATVTVDAVLFFQVLEASKAAYAVENLDVSITNLAMTNLRTVCGSMELDTLLSERDTINGRLLQVLDDATAPWGVKVNRLEVKDVQPPETMTRAMNRQMEAERERRALVTEAEGKKEAAIRQAEGEQRAAVLRAEGARDAARLEAEARERLAEAEANATRMVSEAIAQGDTAAINYFLGLKYVEALQAVASAPNQKLLMMPLDASGIVSSVAGIAEIARDAFGDRRAERRAGGSVPASQGAAAIPAAE